MSCHYFLLVANDLKELLQLLMTASRQEHLVHGNILQPGWTEQNIIES